MKVFTIIKGKSERIPEKNFQDLDGKPLWKHLIEELSELDVYVNTDCSAKLELQGILNIPNTKLIQRSAKHVEWEQDPNRFDSPVLSMVQEFVEEYVTDLNEPIVLTHVTSPFISSSTILNAAQQLNHGFKSVHSVSKIRDFCWLETKDGAENNPINFDPTVVQKTQDLAPVIASKGAFFIFKAGDFLETRDRIMSPCYFYELSHLEAIEIDYPADLEFARSLLSDKS